MKTPIMIKGVEYPSINAAARATGFAVSTVYRYASEGRLEDLGQDRYTRVRIRGAEYPSINAAAEALGVSPSTVSKALFKGRIDNVGLGTGCRTGSYHGHATAKKIEIGGMKFDSHADASRALGKSRGYLHSVLTRLGSRSKQTMLRDMMQLQIQKEKALTRGIVQQSTACYDGSTSTPKEA